MSVKRILKSLLLIVDIFLAALAIPSAIILKTIRLLGIQFLPLSKKALLMVGVFPIRNHYYEPLFDCRLLKRPVNGARTIPGIDWNATGQLELLSRFNFHAELQDIPVSKRKGKLEFYFKNKNFGPGDGEMWYNVIRHFKPKRIVEIGSGYSTLMAQKAIAKNRLELSSYDCKHVCIEPFEMPWLEQIGVQVIRRKVEDVDPSLYETLCHNDILFIDSSHVIKPQGDVLVAFLEILPRLKSGVIVHVHDVFSPHDYPAHWLCDLLRLWNEQYLLEAFLTSNSTYKVICALNYLHHFFFDELKSTCPFLSLESGPSSFYMQRT